MFAVLVKLFCNEDGATAIEYGVVGALTMIAAVTAAIAVMPLVVL